MPSHFNKPKNKWEHSWDIVNLLNIPENEKQSIDIGLNKMTCKELGNLKHYIIEKINKSLRDVCD